MKTVDITVRKARKDDAAALADVFQESWRLAYRGIIPHQHLETITRQRPPAWWERSVANGSGMLVVELAGRVGGYAQFGRNRWPLPYGGEIYELYLAPVYQGVGLGERLFEGCRHALDTHKLPGLLVWALADNEGACAFYRRRGGRPVARTVEKFGATRVRKLGFGWA